MNEKEYQVELSRIDVLEYESRLREAQRNMEEGYTRQSAMVEQAKADMQREYGRLKEEVERARLSLERAKAGLLHSEATLAQGFER